MEGPMRRLFSRRMLLWVLALGMVAGGVGWWQRAAILTWVYVQGLARASDADREAWIERVAGLDFEAVPGLCRCLEKQNPVACDNARGALARLAEGWPPADPRHDRLRACLAHEFPRLSMDG